MADKEWTLMFFFAADNALTPGVVSQLKALKLAGYHEDVNVVAHFDPQSEGTPTHVFEVNLLNKVKNPGKPSDVGFSDNDPYIRTLMEDKLWRNQTDRSGERTIRERLKESFAAKGLVYDPPEPPPDRILNGNGDSAEAGENGAGQTVEPGPRQSLREFLKFCRRKYRAKHYMLFILGHGMVVGNDIFLFDEHVADAEQSLSLRGLGQELGEFAEDVRAQGAEFELVSFHSCSVSSLEVAHELQYNDKGTLRSTANYMLASQGPAFVGSWPYREILIRVFNDVDDLKGKDQAVQAELIRKMVGKIYDYILHNSTDFLLAGYSFQLTLCDLNRVAGTTAPLKELSDALTAGLRDRIAENLILLAHWEAISYWQENYTDIRDFCLRLSKHCEDFGGGETQGTLSTIRTACENVITQLTPNRRGESDKLIARTCFAGPTYQYAHGLSVYFPWAEPTNNFTAEYALYKFAATSWPKFLKEYFKETKRGTRREEKDERTRAAGGVPREQREEDKLQEDIANICFNSEGPLNSASSLDGPAPEKTDVRDPTGDVSSCGTFKNYPHDTRPSRKRARMATGNPPLPLGNDITFF
jgi:hypothetical protein